MIDSILYRESWDDLLVKITGEDGLGKGILNNPNTNACLVCVRYTKTSQEKCSTKQRQANIKENTLVHYRLHFLTSLYFLDLRLPDLALIHCQLVLSKSWEQAYLCVNYPG